MFEPRVMSEAALAAADGRTFIDEMKRRLGDDEAWEEMLTPLLRARTKWGLTMLIDSLAKQRERAVYNNQADARWLVSVDTLRRIAQSRLQEMSYWRGAREPVEVVTVPSSREARAWRGLAASLAEELGKHDPVALEEFTTPYGGLSVAEWLNAREAKREEAA